MNNQDLLAALNADGLDALTAIEIIMREMHSSVALASSFSLEDIVLIDLMLSCNPAAKIFAIDTGRLHEETYLVSESIREHYNVNIQWYFPNNEAVEDLIRANGCFSFYEDIDSRHECCGIRKVEPLNRALSSLKGWITGQRIEQSVTRTELNVAEIDAAHGNILKFNPLARWTIKDIINYISEKKLPYNKLYDQQCLSIGCAPCTRAIKLGEEDRAGRWWWENATDKECGLHGNCKI